MKIKSRKRLGWPPISSAIFVSILFGMGLLSTNSSHAAMSVTPLGHEMVAAGKFSRSVFKVKNTGSRPLPIEVSISRVNLDTNGRISKVSADDDFYVFPPQRMIAPGAAQNFRIQWAGNPNMPQSQSYLIDVNQIPVGVSENVKLGVETVMSYTLSLNVRPMRGESKLALIKTELARDNKGKSRPALTLQNSGNVHARLSDAVIILSADGWSKKLTPSSLRPTLGVGLIQPGKTRRILLPVDLPQNLRNLKASVTLRKAK